MATVYCGSCGASISDTAKFCRACGRPQAVPLASSQPQPTPSPRLPPQPAAAPAAAGSARPLTSVEMAVSTLAVLGGSAMCFIAVYATVYLPVHNGYPVDYGGSPRLGDLLALASGAVAIAIGVLVWTRRARNPAASGIWLVAAGAPTLVTAVIWAFPETLHLSLYPVPFYFAYVYFTDIGPVELGEGFIGMPLAIACAMVIAAGVAIFSSASSPAAPRRGR